MRKLIGLALVCGLAFGGCKCSSESSATSSGDDKATSATGETGSSKSGRSGKIDLGSRRNPTGDTADGDHASGDPAKPSLPLDRRNSRLAEYDTDHDGKISDEERKVARHKRAEQLLKDADKNGDGKVTPEELADTNFRRFDPKLIDADHDGNITSDELEAAIEARSKQWGAGRFGGVDRSGRLGSMGRLRPAPPVTSGSAATPEAPK